MTKALLLAGLALSTASLGCAAKTRYLSPVEARQMLSDVNANFDRIEGAVYFADATVTLQFPNRPPFIGQPVGLAFQPPRCLRFDIRHAIGGKMAEVGSNDERYWVYIQPEVNTMWWGSWQALEAGLAKPVMVPPDQLLAALMVQPLPDRLSGGVPPLATESDNGTPGNHGDDVRSLLYVRGDARGWPYAAREVRLSAKPPHLPVEILVYHESGRQAMRAALSDYQPIEGTGPNGPLAPRRYRIEWIQPDGATAVMDLKVGRVEYYKEDVPCDFPAQWEGKVEPLDLSSPPASAIETN